MKKVILGKAMNFALEKHGNQLYGRKPYHVHLLDVVNNHRRYIEWDELTQEQLDSAWLHDIIEDTSVTIQDIEGLFGSYVAELVNAVTNEPASNRKLKLELTAPKIRNTSGAIILKLADRIANVEQCISYDRVGRRPGRIFMKYDAEWDIFQEQLRGRCKGESAAAILMWQHLDMLFTEGRIFNKT